MSRVSIVVLLFGLLLSSSLLAQSITGCTDPQAKNFNPQANVQDGSCIYGITVYNPPFKYKLPDEVNETSGLIYFGDKLWTINDSGNEPVLYGLDPATGAVVQRIQIGNAKNRDWEDLAQDETYIYIGDFGNNSGGRKYLDIYRIAKSAIPTDGDVKVNSEKIVFQYPDYEGKAEKKKSTNFDCEAFIVAGDSIHLFSKNWGNQQTKHYRIPKTPGNYMADLLFTFNSKGLITSADYNSNTNELILLGYTKNEWVPFMWLLFDFQGRNFFTGNKRRIDMLNIFATQTEGICFTDDRTGMISSEGSRAFSQTAYDFNISRWIQNDTGGISEAGDIEFTLSPNPLEKNKLKVIFKGNPTGQYNLELIDENGVSLPLKKYKMSRKEEKAIIKLKLGSLEAGEYFIRIVSGETFIAHKFTKK